MAAVDALKEILDRLEKENGITISGVVSRNGIPIVCNMPNAGSADTFSTLSATIMGASEVIFSGIGKSKPDLVIMSSPDGNMVCTPISPKSLLVVMGPQDPMELQKIAEKTKVEIKEVFSNE